MILHWDNETCRYYQITGAHLQAGIECGLLRWAEPHSSDVDFDLTFINLRYRDRGVVFPDGEQDFQETIAALRAALRLGA